MDDIIYQVRDVDNKIVSQWDDYDKALEHANMTMIVFSIAKFKVNRPYYYEIIYKNY